MEYRWERHDEPIPGIRVEWTLDILDGTPYPADPEHSPKRFRCFVCLRTMGKRKFGGVISGKPICRWCYPYVDERFIGWLINREKGKSKRRTHGRRLKSIK